MLIDYIEDEAPKGCKKIYHAKITGSIVKIKVKTTKKKGFYPIEKFVETGDTFCIYDVWKEGEEKNEDSYFIKNIRIHLGLNKQKEKLKITSIEKIKYLGYSLV